MNTEETRYQKAKERVEAIKGFYIHLTVYVKNPEDYIFNFDDMERIPYMSPGLVGPEKTERGKTPTDTWWHTIVPTNGKEKTGYPTQKPIGILRRIVQVSSPKNGLVFDFFAGSGTTGAVCVELGRRFILIDKNPTALEVMARRFSNVNSIEWFDFDPKPFQNDNIQASLF